MLVRGNRGRCAQPCRLPYELIQHSLNSVAENSIETPNVSKDNAYGKKSTSNGSLAQSYSDNNYNSKTLDKGYLLSTRDLCSLDLLPTLVNLGITCFKIEGRLKNPEYVATVTRIYRKYIDLAQSDKPYVIDEKDRKDLLQVFNRGGFSTGYLESKPNQNLIYKNKPNNMGIFVGTVSNFNSNKGYITLKLQDDISIGDTVSLEREKGLYTISELMINNKNTPSAHRGDIVKIGRIKGNIFTNDKIFKISSKELNNLADEYINGEKIKSKINCKIVVHKDVPVSMKIYTNCIHENSRVDMNLGHANNCNAMSLNNAHNYESIYDNINFTLTSELIPVASINSPITKERIIEQVNKLGGTPFEFENMEVDLGDNLYIPSISKLNQLRRDCISKLEEILLDRIHRKSTICTDISRFSGIENTIRLNKKITILLNTLNQSFNYSNLKNIDKIFIPLKYFFMPAFSNKIEEITTTTNSYIYMPSILKDSIVKRIVKDLDVILSTYSIKGFVLSNISHIHLLEKYIKDYEFISNYNMNVYNNYTIQELEKLNISCVTLSRELDKV